MTDRLSTGLTALDRRLGDEGQSGLPAGTLVVVETAPGTQYEPILRSLMTQRQTAYLTTVRTADDVRATLERTLPRADYTVRRIAMEAPVEAATSAVDSVDDRMNVVVDPVTPLEGVGGARYVDFCNDLKRRLTDTGSVGVLVAVGNGRESTARERTLVVADVVWDLDSTVEGGSVRHRLYVRKHRGEDLPEEPVTLGLGRQLSVDTSRDIS